VLLLFPVDQKMNVIVHHNLFVIEQSVLEDDQIPLENVVAKKH
jgi:hypothetical protein